MTDIKFRKPTRKKPRKEFEAVRRKHLEDCFLATSLCSITTCTLKPIFLAHLIDYVDRHREEISKMLDKGIETPPKKLKDHIAEMEVILKNLAQDDESDTQKFIQYRPLEVNSSLATAVGKMMPKVIEERKKKSH